MLNGIDISNHQNPKNINYNQYDFYMIKASEGRTLKDSRLDAHYNRVAAAHKLYGFYHYAHPENNDMTAEAKRFLNLVGHHAGRALYALDWEGRALKYGADKALIWLNYVYAKTGVRPLFYTSASNTGRYAKIYQKNYGLWVAHYGVSRPKVRGWKAWAMWQYSDSGNLDKDYFNGDRRTWQAYCKKVR